MCTSYFIYIVQLNFDMRMVWNYWISWLHGASCLAYALNNCLFCFDMAMLLIIYVIQHFSLVYINVRILAVHKVRLKCRVMFSSYTDNWWLLKHWHSTLRRVKANRFFSASVCFKYIHTFALTLSHLVLYCMKPSLMYFWSINSTRMALTSIVVLLTWALTVHAWHLLP